MNGGEKERKKKGHFSLTPHPKPQLGALLRRNYGLEVEVGKPEGWLGFPSLKRGGGWERMGKRKLYSQEKTT